MAVFTAIATGLGALGFAGATAAGVATATTLAATAYGIDQTQRAASAARQSAQVQRQAAETQVKMQREQAARQRRSAVRQTIIARGRARAQAATQQQLGGSGFLGGMASLTSQLGANLGYGTMMSGLGSQYTSLSGQASYLGGLSQMYSTRAGIGFTLASAIGRLDGLSNVPTASPSPQKTYYPENQAI